MISQVFEISIAKKKHSPSNDTIIKSETPSPKSSIHQKIIKIMSHRPDTPRPNSTRPRSSRHASASP